MIVIIICTNMSPTVRALAVSAFEATSERVNPVARNFWYAGERSAAPMNSHQLVRSYSSSRRSSHVVRSCQNLAPKNASSPGEKSMTGPYSRRTSRSRVPTSRVVRGKRVGTSNAGKPYCVNAARVVGTR